MKNILVILAGYPATGKSTFCKGLLKLYPNAPIISPDDIKEEIWDEVGFKNAAEKADLEVTRIWPLYYKRLEKQMAAGGLVITDYPFSDKQKSFLLYECEKNNYSALTIRFVGNLQRIYQRSLSRDLSPSRHLGHLVSCYKKGDVLKNRMQADQLVTFDILKNRCISKGYGEFQLGDLIEVDATDIATVNFEGLVKQVNKYIVK